MTLVVVAARDQYIVQVSDRRLTLPDGSVVEDDEDKAIYFQAPNLQILLGYTGLARIGGTPMVEVLCNCLMSVVTEGKDNPTDFVSAFAAQLSFQMRRSAAQKYAAKFRRLSVIATAYVLEDDLAYGPFQSLITNFQVWGERDDPQAWDEFKVSTWQVQSGLTHIQWVGNYRAIHQGFDLELRPLMVDGKPPTAVRDKIISSFHEFASRSATIGTGLNSVLLRPGEEPISGYHPTAVTNKTQSIFVVKSDGRGFAIATQFEMHAEDPGVVVSVPATRGSRRCPCGSGKLYKNCHGKGQLF